MFYTLYFLLMHINKPQLQTFCKGFRRHPTPVRLQLKRLNCKRSHSGWRLPMSMHLSQLFVTLFHRWSFQWHCIVWLLMQKYLRQIMLQKYWPDHIFWLCHQPKADSHLHHQSHLIRSHQHFAFLITNPIHTSPHLKYQEYYFLTPEYYNHRPIHLVFLRKPRAYRTKCSR